ncbi:MAG: deoxyribonuclease V [Gammaproteobacteria bacterium]|nr:deoxyribonuclease V [Gammaproteobacteria bacterium]
MTKNSQSLSNNLSESQAREIQLVLADKVELTPLKNKINYVAGVDVAYPDNQDGVFAAIVLLDAETLEIVETSTAEQAVNFPYVPGLFSFRELPPVIEAFHNLKTKPDIIVCDGHGIAHPRRFGLASHLGVIVDLPCIGCAKTTLLPSQEAPGPSRGNCADIFLDGESVGRSLRTQDQVNPVYVSPGHKITLRESIEWILRLCPKYRLPETTRQADQAVNTYVREASNKSS